MEIHIHRYRIRDNTCDGILFIDGRRICDTAENTKYMPRKGIYGIELIYSDVHERKVPTLVAINNDQTFERHPCLAIGNGVHNRKDGRIIVGTYITHGCLKNSRKPFMKIYERLKKSISRGHEVTLKITSSNRAS